MHCSVTPVSTGQYDSFYFLFFVSLTQSRVPLGRDWTLHKERLYSNLPMGISGRNVLIDDDVGGRAQATVGGTIPVHVVLNE